MVKKRNLRNQSGNRLDVFYMHVVYIIIVTAMYHTISYVSNNVWCRTILLIFYFNKNCLSQFHKFHVSYQIQFYLKNQTFQ